MQTFLPHPSFFDSARCLDRARLGKQRVEARQLITALKQGGGWANHPAARMWRGYTDALGAYYDAGDGFSFVQHSLDEGQIPLPPWLGDRAFHASHRSNLLRKDPAHYGQFGWTEPADLPYVWP